MRLLFTLHDQDPATTKSLGILKFSTAILHGLACEPRVRHIDVLANSAVLPLLPRDRSRISCHLAEVSAPRGIRRIFWDQWQLARWTARLQPDWLLLPKGFAPLLLRPRAPLSVFVHDDILAYYADRTPRPWSPPEAAYFLASLRRSLSTAACIVTPSRFTAEALAQRNLAPTPPQVIGEPLWEDPSASTIEADPHQVLLPVSPFPHKRSAQAVTWLSRFVDEPGNATLRVTAVGTLPSKFSWPHRPGWTHHPRLSEADYQRVRAASGTLIYFSDYEGFGLPPREALRDGKRAIASDLPAHREALPATILFDNTDYASFRATLQRALANPPPIVRFDSAITVAARWVDALLAATACAQTTHAPPPVSES